MPYLDKNLLPGEEILFFTKKHLIIFLYPIILTIISIYAYQYMHANPILSKLAWVPSLIALWFWCSSGLDYAMSEFIVTNKRVMMREGFFFRHANELRINTISQVNIDQSLLGQFLHYGTVSINAFGSFDAYTLISRPNAFRLCLNQQLDRLS